MKVSIIIPVYNVSKYIERCLKSVLGQTWKDLEIILSMTVLLMIRWILSGVYWKLPPEVILSPF